MTIPTFNMPMYIHITHDCIYQLIINRIIIHNYFVTEITDMIMCISYMKNVNDYP